MIDTNMQFVLVLVLLASPALLLLIVIFGFKRYQHWRNRRSPFRTRFLRLPGATGRERAQELQDKLIELFLSGTISGAYLAGYWMGTASAPQYRGYGFLAMGAVAWVGVSIYVVVRGLRVLRRLRYEQLGVDGEVAVAEVLSELSSSGFRTFHDLPGPNFNIDHVLVGKNGVFALETKTRSKPDGAYQAETDGKVIRFPDFVDTDSTKQAKRNASTLSGFL